MYALSYVRANGLIHAKYQARHASTEEDVILKVQPGTQRYPK